MKASMRSTQHEIASSGQKPENGSGCCRWMLEVSAAERVRAARLNVAPGESSAAVALPSTLRGSGTSN